MSKTIHLGEAIATIAKRDAEIERLRAEIAELVEACSRWLKEYDHPMPSYFREAFDKAKEVQSE